jgi:hypothetical protein
VKLLDNKRDNDVDLNKTIFGNLYESSRAFLRPHFSEYEDKDEAVHLLIKDLAFRTQEYNCSIRRAGTHRNCTVISLLNHLQIRPI